MNECLIATPPARPATGNSYGGSPSPLSHRKIFLLAAAAIFTLLIVNLFGRVGYTGDEGFYGVTALNMIESPTYLLRPSYYPAGDFLTDKDAFAHPPFNSYFYALVLWLSFGSLPALEFLNALSFGLLLFFAWRLLKLYDAQAAGFAILLLAASPAIFFAYSQLEAEPLMIVFGIISLYCALRGGFVAGQRQLLFFSGVCLGMSFALKLWLCGPLVLAVATTLFIRARQARVSLRQMLLPLVIFGVGAVMPAAVHLLAIACVYPQDLGFWLKNIYFGIFTKAGISGTKLSGVVPSDWVHPFWYYGAALYRDHFFLGPLILLGAGSLLRDPRLNREFLWIILAGAAGVLPLSLMQVKEPYYVLACAVFLYFLAGACLAALVRRISSNADIDLFSRRFGTAVIAGLFGLVLLAYALGLMPARITGRFVIAHSIILALFLAMFWWSRRRERARGGSFALEWAVYAACAVALLVLFCFGVTRQPRDKVIARVIQPYIQGTSPATVSFIASNFKCYQFYSFRRGSYWEDVPLQQDPASVLSTPKFSHVRVFIIDPKDQKTLPDTASWLRWLELNAVEKTRDIDAQLGFVSGFRLFVR